jgi:hypothetical protein
MTDQCYFTRIGLVPCAKVTIDVLNSAICPCTDRVSGIVANVPEQQLRSPLWKGLTIQYQDLEIVDGSF